MGGGGGGGGGERLIRLDSTDKQYNSLHGWSDLADSFWQNGKRPKM